MWGETRYRCIAYNGAGSRGGAGSCGFVRNALLLLVALVALITAEHAAERVAQGASLVSHAVFGFLYELTLAYATLVALLPGQRALVPAVGHTDLARQKRH